MAYGEEQSIRITPSLSNDMNWKLGSMASLTSVKSSW
ncbi:Uncharacterised protein [Vibrio cholerae]|nr:Uncharacterised protein [Vibrio cholerae]